MLLTRDIGEAALSLRRPDVQQALLLRGPRLRYELVHDHPLPSLQADDEVLVRVDAIGLNPIDWKSADYGFALPTLPAVNGRDLAGTVVKVGASVHLRVGDKVFGPSTQYRDYRTSAFQQYAVAKESCLGRVPASVGVEQCAALGVGASTAALAIGSSLGIAVLGFAPRSLAIGAEGEDNSAQLPVAVPGDWLLIWGAGTVTGFFSLQLARLAGVKVIAVANPERHGERLRAIGVEHIVDRRDLSAAIARIREITGGRLRFALDCIGRETATLALEAFGTEPSVLVGLSGLPKEVPANVQVREVPVKTFHTNPAVGRALMTLVESLIMSDELHLPPVEVVLGGLSNVNDALDRLRAGNLAFGRLVVQQSHSL